MKTSDKPCARCHERPRHVRSSGVVISYCGPCHSKAVLASKRKRRDKPLLEAIFWKPEPVCAMCLDRPRRAFSSGRSDSYCRECRNVYQRNYQREQRRLILEAAAAARQPKKSRLATWLERARAAIGAAA